MVYVKGGAELNINLLKSEIVKNGLTQAELAKRLGMSEVTFSRKLRRDKFGTDEAKLMTEILNIDNPLEIFFEM